MSKSRMSLPIAPSLPPVSATMPHMPPPANDGAFVPIEEAPADKPTARRAGLTRPASPEASSPVHRAAQRASGVHQQFIQALRASQERYFAAVARGLGVSGISVAEEQSARPLASAPEPQQTVKRGDAALSDWLRIDGEDVYADLAKAPWLKDHCPDYGASVIPMTGVADIVCASAQAACPDKQVVAIRNLSVRTWFVVTDRPIRIKRHVEFSGEGTASVSLSIWRSAARAELSREETVAKADVVFADAFPAAPPMPAPLSDATVSPNPYQSANLFHGPSFQLLTELMSNTRGARGRLRFNGAHGLPVSALHPIALDAALHSAADGRWEEWCTGAKVESGNCLPLKLAEIAFYSPTPQAGDGFVEVRGDGVDGNARFPTLVFHIHGPDSLWAVVRLVFVAAPEGPMDRYPKPIRRQFLRDREYIEGVSFSQVDGSATVLTDQRVAMANWLPLTIETAYSLPQGGDVTELAAKKEHAARIFRVHPSQIQLDGNIAINRQAPDQSISLKVTRDARQARVETA